MSLKLYRLSLALLLTGVASGSQSFAAATEESNKQIPDKQIPWVTNYEIAKKMAQEQNKPLFVYFTGSDWCGWCNKMDGEILKSTAFTNSLLNKMIFVYVDFPNYKALDPNVAQQNERLKKDFKIQGFPTIVILTPELKQVATLYYDPSGPESFVQKVNQAIAK